MVSLTFLLVLLFGQASGQTLPPIGIVDFYGLRSVSEQQARQALQIKEGDAVPESREESQRRLEALPNVLQARIKFVCCVDGKVIVYVGIKERGAPTLQFRRAPHGAIRLPDNIFKTGEALEDAIMKAVQKGEAGEDDSHGHALFNNAEARAIQQRFITFAAQDLKLLRAVLRESSEAQHRALAAQIIAYTANKRDVVQDLVYGMSDPDDDVRNNSMRALAIIARLAQNEPLRGIKVPIQPFVQMLNSIVWSDRNKSSLALMYLTEKRDAAIISNLRKHALQSLVEMSRWKNPDHANAPFFILGRIGNFSDEEIQRVWNSGNRESLITAVLNKSREIKRGER